RAVPRPPRARDCATARTSSRSSSRSSRRCWRATASFPPTLIWHPEGRGQRLLREGRMTELERYLAEEIAEDHVDGIITRREAMRRLGVMGVTATAGARVTV